MFTPVQTEYRPPVASAQGPPAAPAPPTTSSIADVPSTAPPSVGPDSPHDGSPGEEGTNGHGGARRPGNLWTAEDREDMFNRRERGEGWETICADYPNRSRHAMQQQYSMMKKQKALADGTWASNRRGRKRRNPAAPERPSAAAKRAEQYAADIDDNMTEVDELDDMASEEPEDSDVDANGRGMSHSRPNNLMRSATEPASNKKPRGAASVQPANGTATDLNGAASIKHQLETLPEQSSGFAPVNRNKRRRLSTDRTSNATPPVEMLPTGVGNIVLCQEDLLALIRKGNDWARKSQRAVEEDRQVQTQAYEQAISRANKKMADAQDKLSYASFEHGEAMKKARLESNETLKLKNREMKDTVSKLKADHSKQVEELRRELALLKKSTPERELDQKQEIARLKADISTLQDAKKAWEATAKAPEVGTLIKPTTIVPPPQESFPAIEAEVQRATHDMYEYAEKTAAIIAKFNGEFEDLGHKHQVQYLADLSVRSQDTLTMMDSFRAKFDKMHQALNPPASSTQHSDHQLTGKEDVPAVVVQSTPEPKTSADVPMDHVPEYPATEQPPEPVRIETAAVQLPKEELPVAPAPTAHVHQPVEEKLDVTMTDNSEPVPWTEALPPMPPVQQTQEQQ